MNNDELSKKILSDITVFSKYAKYLPKQNRRETWEELVYRSVEMHCKKFPSLESEIIDAFQYVLDKKVVPSMRSLQFGGKPIDINPARGYNCAAVSMDHYKAFSEVMFLLLGGSGTGISVQKNHVEKLPPVRTPIKHRRFLVGDSIEGWAESVNAIISAYMNGKAKPLFDFRDIRPKGSRLITAGGKAPGPQPLKDCLHNIEKVLSSAISERGEGTHLKTIEVHDICCYIADAVLAGGIRRAAILSMFSYGDEDMLTSKFGNWWEMNPQRGRANNSVILLRNRITKEDFDVIWEKVKASNAGEPGIIFTNNADILKNPCVEISLKSCQFCNLTEVNVSNLESQEDFNARVRAAAFIGTIQASYTDFHFLRDVWKRNTEKDALLGVSLTGIASGEIFKYNIEEASKVSVEENKRVAKLIGINSASRVNTLKPSGTTSVVLGCSSGIHAWHDHYYIRRIRVGKNESLYHFLKENHPEIVEDEFFRPNEMSVISIPIKAPENAIIRTESPIDLLDRVKKFHTEWIKPGHKKGDDTHNVSVTVSIKDDEWESVGEWMWNNRYSYNGISVLPFDTGSYKQTPFESITKEQYEEMLSHIHNIDLTKIVEEDDHTDLSGELACSGGACEIK